MIYFDNAGSTLVDEEVLSLFIKEAKENFANPSSNHGFGQRLAHNIENFKLEILKSLKLDSKLYDVIFTSGVTEANNLAIQGVAHQYKKRGNHLITSKIEHPSVLNVFKKLENEGFKVSYIDVDNYGNLNLEELKNCLSKETILISFLKVNNETGSILNLNEVKELIKDYRTTFFHSDLAQSVGKIDENYSLFDLMSISSYKLYGLKGIGCLIKKKNIILEPLFYGGGQENGFRSGTMDYPLISSFSFTLKKAIKDLKTNYKHVQEINNYLITELKKIEQIEVHDLKNKSPYILNFSFKNSYSASVVVEALSNKEIYVSTTSSCASKLHRASYVIEELTSDTYQAINSIRLSFSKYNTIEEAKTFISELKNILSSIRKG